MAATEDASPMSRRSAIMFGRGYFARIIEKYLGTEFELIAQFGKDAPQERVAAALEKAEVAFVITPMKSHYALCRQALENGCHVFVEKPTTETLQEFRDLAALATMRERVIFTDYIYTFSESVNNALKILKNNATAPKSLSGSITQYGKFYEGETVLEVLGVHWLSVFAQMCSPEYRIFNNLKVVRCHFDDTQKHSVHLYLEAERNEECVPIELFCSLISRERTRLLKIRTDSYLLEINLQADASLRQIPQYPGTTSEKTMQFDERNNLVHSIDRFKLALNGSVDNSSHLSLCARVAELVSTARAIAEYP